MRASPRRGRGRRTYAPTRSRDCGVLLLALLARPHLHLHRQRVRARFDGALGDLDELVDERFPPSPRSGRRRADLGAVEDEVGRPLPAKRGPELRGVDPLLTSSARARARNSSSRSRSYSARSLARLIVAGVGGAVSLAPFADEGGAGAAVLLSPGRPASGVASLDESFLAAARAAAGIRSANDASVRPRATRVGRVLIVLLREREVDAQADRGGQVVRPRAPRPAATAGRRSRVRRTGWRTRGRGRT